MGASESEKRALRRARNRRYYLKRKGTPEIPAEAAAGGTTVSPDPLPPAEYFPKTAQERLWDSTDRLAALEEPDAAEDFSEDPTGDYSRAPGPRAGATSEVRHPSDTRLSGPADEERARVGVRGREHDRPPGEGPIRDPR